MTSHRCKQTFLENMEQLDLHMPRHLSNLIQKNGTVAAATVKYPFMVFHSSSKSPFFMAKKLRFQQRFGKLGDINGDECPGKTFLKTAFFFIKGNKTAPADCHGCRALAGTGLAEDQGGKILHTVPQYLIIQLNIVGKNIIPQIPLQLFHAGTCSHQRIGNKKKCTAQLE